MSKVQEKWNIDILTLFPEAFPGILKYSLAGKAIENNIWQLNIHNLREFSHLNHKKVDEKVYGGGAGLLIRADVLGNAVDKLECTHKYSRKIYLSPRGKVFKHEDAKKIASENNILFICGRYEGVDQRFLEYYNVEEMSIGDYVLSGGELAAQVIIDASLRFVPGVLKNTKTATEESFSGEFDQVSLLEYPQYTKPRIWNNMSVPEILVSGDHKKIENWKKESSIEVTKRNRPDLWEKYSLNLENNKKNYK